MIRWFRRRDPDDEFEDDDYAPLPDTVDFGEQPEAAPEYRPPPEVPEYAVVIAAAASHGWHMAAVLTDSIGPDFYLRAITVRWPFVVARPTPSTRASDRHFNRAALSPTGSTPARKVVVNWGWIPADGSVSQLRFYIKRMPNRLFRGVGRATVRLTLKESGWPRRRIVVPVKSNRIDWDVAVTPKPALLPEQSGETPEHVSEAAAQPDVTPAGLSEASGRPDDTTARPSEPPGHTGGTTDAPPP